MLKFFIYILFIFNNKISADDLLNDNGEGKILKFDNILFIYLNNIYIN